MRRQDLLFQDLILQILRGKIITPKYPQFKLSVPKDKTVKNVAAIAVAQVKEKL